MPLNEYMDAHIRRLIDECPGYGVQDISRLQSQCAKTTFFDQSRYNIMYQKVVRAQSRGVNNKIY